MKKTGVKKLEKNKNDAKNARDALNEAQNELISSYGEGVKTVIDTAFTIAPIFSGGVPNSIISRLASGLKFDKNDQSVDSLVDKITAVLSKNQKLQNDYITKSQQLSNVLLEEAINKNLLQLKRLLPPIQEQLERINTEIQEILEKMKVAQTVNSGKETESVQTPIVPEGFTQVLIDVAASQIDKESNSQSSASNSTYGASLWFAGYSGKKETTSSIYAELCQSQNTSVRVGMNVAKVGIEREWFNPGIFVLTKDMFNVSTSRVSPIKDYSEITEERLQDMSRSHILPCYPVAMLVAKDISIQVATSDQLSNTFSATMEEHFSHGGGFLLFSGAKSSSSSFGSSGIHTSSTDKSFNIKITTPQIIGYYLQATPADKSTIIDEISDDEMAAGFVTISKFVEDYKKLLQAMNKNNTEQQN